MHTTADPTWQSLGIDVPPGSRGEIDTTCPWCSGQRKKKTARCLSVNTDLETYFCHHCGVSGGLKSGQRNPSDPDPYGASLRPKEWAPPRALPAVTAPTLWEKATEWFLTERGIGPDVLSRNHVTIAREWCPVCEEYRSHVLFPYFRDGVHVNTKHRCMAKHFRMEKGAERVLYGLPDVADADTIVIVEGEIDKLSLEMAGIRNGLSVPDGAPSPDAKHYASKFTFLDSAAALFDRAKTVIIASDADAPGQALQDELARRIGKEKCRIVTWPVGIKDANECLVQIGATELKRCIDAAEPVKIDGIWTIGDLEFEIDSLYENGFNRGVGTGWPRFDSCYRTRTGLVTIVTGIPSHGKSAFVDALLVQLATLHDWSFAVCSPENQPLERHAAGILAKYLGKPFHPGPLDRMTRSEMESGKDWMQDHFAFVLPEEPTIDAILERIRVLVLRMGVKGVVIDPWNEIDHSRPASMTETEYVSKCLSALRRFARHYDVHLWLVAHPTKLGKTVEGTEPIPTLWDISGSAHFRNKADAGLTVWRDVKDSNAMVQVHINKMRFAELGQLGMVEFDYTPATGRYREAPR